jgi:hypothetical protein
MKIKPTGLKGVDKIQRIQNLMGKLSPINESVENSSLEHIKYGPDGIAYGIVRENHNYFIKTTEKNTDKLSASDFEYIGGLQNKLDESYNSYEEALKHLNMRFKDLNEFYNIRENIDLFKSDILTESSKSKKLKKEQDEETTFKLKVDAPEQDSDVATDLPVPTDVPADDIESPEVTDVPADDTTADDMAADFDMGDSEEDSDDLEKDIQRLTGKIGQKMRELDEPNPELEKYVINSIMSALDVDSMDEDFKEDLISKLEGEESEDEETPTDEEPSEEETTPEEESAEEEVETKSESRIITKKSLMEKLKSKKILKNKLKKTIVESDEFYGKFRNMDDEWISSKNNRRQKMSDNDWDEEETFDDYESFSSKYPKHNWFSGSHKPEGSKMMFNTYKDMYGPLSIRKKSKMGEDEMLDEEETITSYKDLNDFKTNGSKLTSKQKFNIGGVEGNFMKEMNEDENIYEIELDEDWMEEGNKFTDMLRKTKKGDTFKIGKRSYKDTSSYDDLDEDFDFEMGDESRPLHRKPFDLNSVNKNMDLEEDLEMFNRRDKDSNNIPDRLEVKSNNPTIAPPPVKTPPKTPRRDRPFKPQIKPQIQPKGERY